MKMCNLFLHHGIAVFRSYFVDKLLLVKSSTLCAVLHLDTRWRHKLTMLHFSPPVVSYSTSLFI